MKESIISDNKSIRLDDETNDFGESICVPRQTQIMNNNGDNDNSLNEEKEINLSNINSSLNINKDKENESKINLSINLNSLSNIKDNKKRAEKSELRKIICHGNRINSLILAKKKNISIHLKIDKEKSSKEGHTIYEISTIVEKVNELEKNILCYRRYNNFNLLYELLKKRYPHYIFPRLSPKLYTNKVIDNENLEMKRRNELEYFINEIYDHYKIGKGEEIKKFLKETKFDKHYFENSNNFFEYPEFFKKKNESGLISMGVNGVTSLVSYFIGKKSSEKNERIIAKKILNEEEKVDLKIKKYNSTLDEIKNIFKCLKIENKEKKSLYNNLLYLKNENDCNENNTIKKNFNELIEINKEFSNEKYEEILQLFEIEIVNPLDFCILDLEGEIRAIERFKIFLQNYNTIINYKNQGKDNKGIYEEQIKIKEDINLYEETLIKEMERVEENYTKIYNDIIHKLCIILSNSTEILIEKYKNSNLVK